MFLELWFYTKTDSLDIMRIGEKMGITLRLITSEYLSLILRIPPNTGTVLDRSLTDNCFKPTLYTSFFLPWKERRKEFFSHIFPFAKVANFCWKIHFTLGKTPFPSFFLQKFTINKLYLLGKNKWGWTSGVSQAILYVKLFSHNQCFFWVSFVVYPNVAILYRKI